MPLTGATALSNPLVWGAVPSLSIGGNSNISLSGSLSLNGGSYAIN